MVLKKGKWDAKAQKKHDKKISEKKPNAAAEERQKKEERAAKRADIPRAVSRNVAASSLEPMRPRPPRGPVTPGTRPTVGDMPPSSSEDEEDENEEGESSGNFSRRKKMDTNSWRYEEPEPEPGEEMVEEQPSEDYVSITKSKLAGIASREAREAKIAPLDIRDYDNHGGRTRVKHEGEWEKGKNVVVVPREDFRDVTEKIAKRDAVDEFRQKFGGTGKKADEVDIENEEDDLDALIGGLAVKAPIKALNPLERIPVVISGKKDYDAPVERTPRVIAGKKDFDGMAQDRVPKVIAGKKNDYEDDDWLDSKLSRR